MNTLTHKAYNKHGPLQCAIDDKLFADESHIAPDDYP